jgi:hypothetical protein
VFCSASAPAVRSDPQYTEAWASLSANLAFHGAAFEERIAKARDAAAKMIGLDPRNPDARQQTELSAATRTR